ncbi:MAG: SDR family oxidoreductase [Rhodospirillaceae bacterium]|jgi:NAD(P)-dependent dehydrogenase (short-subunit alcohol dehydrogenase family)|nr:SDR family oxidoreductase [Rhodospirillaceae bacterium]
MTKSPLEGRRAIVTGGAKSMGLHFARALANAGANVALGDVVEGDTVAADIHAETGRDCFYKHLDVSDEQSAEAFCAETAARFGGIDILVNNAAIFASARLGPFGDGTADEWNRMFAVNVTGSFLMAKYAVPIMSQGGFGRIINIGSGTAHKGMPNMVAYVSSKAALLGFTRSLARELGDKGITVNTLGLGLIESDSIRDDEVHMSFTDRVVASRSIHRSGQPDDPLGALLYLAGDASGFMTGQTLMVDGGSVNL